MIRLLTKADAKQYWELRLQALQVNPEAFITTYEEAVRQENPLERVASNLSSNSSFTFGAFNNENRLVGVVTLLTEEKDAYKHKGHIVAMYVDTENRRSGLARALIRKAIERAKEMKLEQLNLGLCQRTNQQNAYMNQWDLKRTELKKGYKMNGVYSDDEHMVLFF